MAEAPFGCAVGSGDVSPEQALIMAAVEISKSVAIFISAPLSWASEVMIDLSVQLLPCKRLRPLSRWTAPCHGRHYQGQGKALAGARHDLSIVNQRYHLVDCRFFPFAEMNDLSSLTSAMHQKSVLGRCLHVLAANDPKANSAGNLV